MRAVIARLFPCAFALVLALAPASALAAAGGTIYVTDVMTVPLRTGPSNAHRILHRGLPSGTALQRLGEDETAGFTHVRLDNGTEGWLPTQFLVSEPIARDRLETAVGRAVRLEADLTELRRRYQDSTAARAQTDAASGELQARVLELESELIEIRQVSAAALDQHTENRHLRELNQRLRDELDDLVGDIRELEANQQQRWLLSGGGLVFGGLVLGAWLSRSRRSRWG
jgi:SH3 domain protein